jgi:ADP-ribose pyrophosphatase YjhB (NUDIX family)
MAAVTTNRFGDLILRSQDVPDDIDAFIDALEALVEKGKLSRAPCVWVNLEDIHIEQTRVVLLAGFETFQVVSSMYRRYVRYRKVLDASVTDMSFAQASHYLSVSAVVVDDTTGNVLCVRDAFPGRKIDAPKLVTGEVKHNEGLEEAAVREVYEEVGLRAQPQGILGFWHNTHGPNGLGSVLFGVLLHVPPGESTQLRPNRKEIKNAAWFPMDTVAAMFEDRPEEAWLRATSAMTPVPASKSAFKRWTGYLSGYADDDYTGAATKRIRNSNAVYSGGAAAHPDSQAMNPAVSSPANSKSPSPRLSKPIVAPVASGKVKDSIIGSSSSAPSSAPVPSVAVAPAGTPNVGGNKDGLGALLGSWTLNVSSPVSGGTPVADAVSHASGTSFSDTSPSASSSLVISLAPEFSSSSPASSSMSILESLMKDES